MRRIKPYLFLLPILLFAAGFVYYPFVRTFTHSLSVVNRRGETLSFAGLDNFRQLFSNPTFHLALRNTLTLTALVVPTAFVIALGLALLCAKKRVASPVYELMFTMPMAVSMPAAAMIFRLLLSPGIGIVNHLLGLSLGWYNDPATALYGIALVCLWIGVPFDFLLFLSALRAVPEPLIESAMIDGAGYWIRFLRIQLPIITPTALFVVCANTVLAMMTAAPVMIITEGGPARSTTTLIYLMYVSGYQSSDYSMAAAISLVTFALTFTMILLAITFERRAVRYS
jgi:sn-glycerol 3-phosphate transport system permease protein